MSVTDNVISAVFREHDRRCVVGPLWQYDYGQILKFEGIELPAIYEVHFSNNPHGTAKVVYGTEDGASIPDEYLTTGASVFAWLFLHSGQDDGGTEYQVEIVVRRRAKPTAEAPTPQEHDLISELIADMTVASEGARIAKDEAVAAAESASENRDAADEAAILARSYAEGGTGTRNGEDTDNAKYWAQQASDAVDTALQDIEDAKADAVSVIESHESNMLAYKDDAIAAKEDAEDAKSDAEDARDAAQRYAAQAESAVQEAMYISFDVEDGDLWMTKTSNTTAIDFTLEEGDLIFNAVTNS